MADNHLFLLAKENRFLSGNVQTDDDGSVTFSFRAGETRVLKIPFSLPRSSDTGLGTTLKSVDCVLRVVSGTLTSVTPVLNRLTHTNLADQTSTAVALTAAAPAFVLVPNGTASNFNRNVVAVTTPTIDNQTTTTSVSYQFQLTFVATAASTVELHGVDVLYSSVAAAGDGGVSSPVRAGYVEPFNQLVALNANVGLVTSNKDFEVTGTNAAASTLAVGGGVTMTTAGADNDQVILTPHLDAGQSGWTTTLWGTEDEVEWNCSLTTPADIANVLVWAGLKLTSDPTIATDADQVFFRFSSDDTDTTWRVIDSIADTDTNTDSSVTMVASTLYRLKVVVDSSRVARCYVNDTLVRTTSALTDAVDLIPYVGVQSLSAAADALTVHKTSISRAI